MQFVEASMIGVRSARLAFSSPTSPVRVTLFPMVHVGQAEFYRDTYADARAHDIVFVEGIKSPIATRIARSYRWLVGSRAMTGLIVQPRLTSAEPGPRIVHADLSPQEFQVEWSKVPLWIRLAIYLIAPILGPQRRWSSRATLAKGMSCEDQPTLAELLAISPETGALTQAVLHARDKRLIDRLRVELDTPRTDPVTLAIVYGAGHMRAVTRELSDRHFVVSGGEWRTIFAID